MKTSVLTTMVLALTITSCSYNTISDINLNLNTNQKIGFNTMRHKAATRYANDNQSSYQVYALIENTTSWYFNTTVIPTASTDTTAIDTTSATYYWPGTKNVTFYAYAPSTISTSSITATSPPTITIDYTIKEEANLDFTIATPVTQSGPATGATNSPVPLVFKHMLTKLDFRLDLSTDLTNEGYALNSDYITAITVPYSSGTIEVSSDSPTWSMDSTSYATYATSNYYIIMPQTFSDTDSCALQFQDVVITRGDATFFSGSIKSFNLTSAEITNSTFLQGYHYDIIVTISSGIEDSTDAPIFNGEINFKSSLAAWDVVSISDIAQP